MFIFIQFWAILMFICFLFFCCFFSTMKPFYICREMTRWRPEMSIYLIERERRIGQKYVMEFNLGNFEVANEQKLMDNESWALQNGLCFCLAQTSKPISIWLCWFSQSSLVLSKFSLTHSIFSGKFFCYKFIYSYYSSAKYWFSYRFSSNQNDFYRIYAYWW